MLINPQIKELKELKNKSETKSVATFFKVVVLGDGGIGKTSICNYLTTGEFFGSYKLSIGADFFSKKLVVDGEDVTLQICDIGGQDQFAEISNIFTKGAHGAILCYDTTRRDTLDSLNRWIQKLEDENVPKVLVSTKNDIEDLKEVLDEEGVQTAQKFNIPYFIPTTSLKGIGITETFEAISRLMLMHKKGLDLPTTAEMIDVNQPSPPEVYHATSSQQMAAQPLGIGRVPSEEQQSIEPPTTVEAPVVQAPELVPPTIEQPEVQPSFTEPINLSSPTSPEETNLEEEEIKPPIISETPTSPQTEPEIQQPTQPQEYHQIDPPTEPEKTATQPLSSISPPISEQKPESTPETQQKSNFTFLDRLREERKKLEEEEEENY